MELQSVDTRLNAVRARIATFPKKTAEIEARVTNAKSELDAAKAAQLNTIKERKKYELDVEQHKDRVRRYKDQTGQVKTNEAYKALQHEVEMAEAEIAKAEDRLLEQMVNGEEYDRRIKASETLLKEVEQVAVGLRSTLDREKAEADKELGQLTEERTRVAAEVPENTLHHYDRIMRKHNNIAVAEVRDESCGACGVRIRPHVIQEMRRGDRPELFECETCTRILHYTPPNAADSIAAAAPRTNAAGHES
jgi:predicted  nucleic acid-binding Zn-ribbon protein